MHKRVIVTVGPSILADGTTLGEIHDPSYIYRVNGAHGDVAAVEEHVRSVRRQAPGADIVIDLPGNKVRTAHLDEPIPVAVDRTFRLSRRQLNYPGFVELVGRGDRVLADDSTLTFVVEGADGDGVELRSLSSGLLRANKGLHVPGINRGLPFLFDRDRDLIDAANRLRVSHVGLSFVRTVDDVREAEALLDAAVTPMAKIETRAAVENLNDILGHVSHIIVDRGDLSTEVGLVKVPSFQKHIIEKALFFNRRVFLATQFLRNMVDKPVPTIAEMIDLYSTLKLGIYGIQLSEETAVGRYPRQCLAIIAEVIREIHLESK